MGEVSEFLVRAVLIGIGATVAMDLWALLLKRGFGIASLSYAMVGRWLGHLTRGQFVHENIAQAPRVRAESMIGWTAHYVIGIAFAGLLLAIFGLEWAREPTLVPALGIGLATLIAPFLILQPGMGLGIAASKTPKPGVARLRSVVTHTVFGLGLYVAALLSARLINL